MKRYIFIILAAFVSIIASAANTLSLSSVSGTPQTEVEVAVSLDNSDAISALEITIPLSEHLQYVNGSATLIADRSNGHMLSAAQVEQDLRIYVYSFSTNPIKGDSGELIRFRLLLGNEPANYTLNPSVVLSNAQGSAIESSAQAGQVSILAPKLQIITEQIDYGHIPIRATYTQDLQLENVGNLPLEITNIVVNDPHIAPTQTLLTIEAYSTAWVTLTYSPVERGSITREIKVTSNAINGEQVASIIADPFSVNELHIGNASGIADSIVTISLTMNNMESIVAMQCTFILPKELEYVDNSFVINNQRSNGHLVLSSVKKHIEKEYYEWYEQQGDTLVLAIFSMTNQSLIGNDGEIANFKLRLNGSSGTYTLYPTEVVLSNITEENMVSAVYEGYVDIQSPSFWGEENLYFGENPITEIAKAQYQIHNYGGAPLQIERVTFLAEGYSIVDPLPLTINPWEEKSITVAYQPTIEGDFSTTMNIYTNDPNNRLKTVALSGHVFEPNLLTMEGQSNEDGTYTLSVGLDNYTDIVAVQYDIHWRNDMATTQSALIPSSRIASHSSIVTPMGNDTYRIIIFSMTNTPIAGHSGELHKLVYTPQNKDLDYSGSLITIDNIVISSVNGKDKSSISNLSYTAQQIKWTTKIVQACDTYTWNEKVYTQSGTYVDTLTTIAGCDSIVTLLLTINNTRYTEETVTACDSYYWNEETYTESGDYTYTTTSASGCDSIVTLHLTINFSEYEEVTQIACNSFSWNDSVYYESGDYTFTTETAEGCIRTEVLHLIIGEDVYTDFYETACDSYEWYGDVYTKSGDYTYYFGTQLGCDSIEILHLTINYSDTLYLSEIACDSYEWHGVEYTTSGTYEYLTQTIHGCDSLEVLTLTVNHSDTAYFTEVACDSYLWHGVEYTTSGTYEYLTQTIHGCDSLEVLTLTINGNTQYSDETATACDTYTWNGETYTESGDYVYTTVAANGCDSIVTLHLTILPDATTETEELALCPSELPYDWYGQSITEAGTYSAAEPYAGMECDSVIHELTLNVYVQTLPATVTLPIVRMGEAIDVTIPTAEIQAHIAAETWYAPNALVAWYILENSDWASLTNEPVAVGIEEVTLKYAVETDCGNIESDKMVIAVETTGLENIPTDVMGVYKVLRDNKIFIIRGGKAYSIMGHLVGDKSVIDPAVTIQ